MESQPQNPEFRNNPENFHPCLRKAIVNIVLLRLCMNALTMLIAESSSTNCKHKNVVNPNKFSHTIKESHLSTIM